MSKIFESIQGKRPRYSGFDLSHEKKLSMNMGDLVPVYLEEIVPGDQFKVKTEIMMRLAPMLAPVMHRVNVYMHYFFVPNRIIWNEWEEFITGGQEGTSTPVYPLGDMSETVPQGSLADYLGLPTNLGVTEAFSVSLLPFRAYQKIFYDYFRDPNLDADYDVNNTTTMTAANVLFKRRWEKDYFTSALPWTQRGPEINFPASINYKPTSDVVITNGSDLGNGNTDVRVDGTGTGDTGPLKASDGSIYHDARIENLDSDNPLGITINDLRRSSALQRWLEKNARGGYRYIEQIFSHFGVKSSDARLQRPEYLGGGRQPVVISEVLNTTGTTEAPQGTMAGHGISMGTTNQFKKRFEEHGYVMGILSVLPRTVYQQGIPRHFLREAREEYFWPEFAHLGEQEIYKAEIFYDNAANEVANRETWGYQQRYAEYKYGCSTVHGDFREELDFWHMGRKFASLPPLNTAFNRSDPTDRIFAVQDGSHTLWCQVFNNVKARRPIPYFADPRLS